MKITRTHLRRLIMEELSGQGRPWGGVREQGRRRRIFETVTDPSQVDVTEMFSDQYGADQVGIAYVAIMQEMRDSGESDDPITPDSMFERLKAKLEELFPTDTDDEEDVEFSGGEDVLEDPEQPD